MLQEPQTDMLLTVEDVAEMLSIARRTVWRWVDLGTLPAPVKLTPRTVRWRASALQAFLDRRAVRAAGGSYSADR